MRILTLLFKANRLWYEATFTNKTLRNIRNLVAAHLKVPASTLVCHVPMKKVLGPSLDEIAHKFNVKGLTYGDGSRFYVDPTALDGLVVGVDNPTDLRLHVQDADAVYSEPSGIFNLGELETAWQTSPVRRRPRT